MDKQATISHSGTVRVGEYTCVVKVDATISLSMVRLFLGSEDIALQKVNFHDIVGESNSVINKLIGDYCEREQARIQDKTPNFKGSMK